MKLLFFLVTLNLFIGCKPQSKLHDSVPRSKRLIWSDEFEIPGYPDPAKWDYDTGGNGWGNNELQMYTAKRTENARVKKGCLVVEVHKESQMGRNYSSARLKTKEGWLYGRIDVMAKLPKGRGTWPAIWMLPVDNSYGIWPKSGEIDLMEYVGFDPGKVHGTVHTEAYNHMKGTQKSTIALVADAEDDFHVYSIDWSVEHIIFLIDNKPYFTFKNENTGYKSWPFNKPFYLLLNIAVGGSWGGQLGIDDSIWPQEMLVDYVRIYH